MDNTSQVLEYLVDVVDIRFECLQCLLSLLDLLQIDTVLLLELYLGVAVLPWPTEDHLVLVGDILDLGLLLRRRLPLGSLQAVEHCDVLVRQPLLLQLELSLQFEWH